MIYHFSSNFPKGEILGLTNQMRRASVSKTTNITVGAARKSEKEFIQFLYCTRKSTGNGSPVINSFEPQVYFLKRLQRIVRENSISRKTVEWINKIF